MKYAPENDKKVSLKCHVDCEIYNAISVLGWVEDSHEIIGPVHVVFW